MPRPAPTSPTCLCGYDLSGLPGPPWTCPECAQVTTVWPPRDSLTFLARDLWQWRLSLTGAIVCPLILPWTYGDIVTVYSINTVLVVLAIMSTLVVSSMLSHESSQSRRLSPGLPRTLWFLFTLLSTAALSVLLAFLSALAHDFVTRPR